jgi:hypothetical protein
MSTAPNRQLPLGCEMPPADRARGIVWLEIHAESGGYFLYQFVEKNGPAKWDTLYHDLDDVFDECQRVWGIDRGAWKPIGE